MLKSTILGAAVNLARVHGLHRVTRLDVARDAGCSTGAVSFHFGNMDGLSNAIVEYAVQHQVLKILAQAKADKHPALGRMSTAIKARVADYLTR